MNKEPEFNYLIYHECSDDEMKHAVSNPISTKQKEDIVLKNLKGEACIPLGYPKPDVRCKLCYGTGLIKMFANPNDKQGKMDLCDCVKKKLRESK